MKHLILTLTVCVAVFIFSSCANHESVETLVDKPEQAKLDKLVARVSSVNKSANYVLIQRYGRLIIPEDSIVYTLNNSTGQEQASSLKITGEELGQFLAADIMSGNPVVGDAVYLRDLERKVTASKLKPLAANHPNAPQVAQGNVSSTEPSIVAPPQQVIEDLKPKLDQGSAPILPIAPGDNLLPVVE